MLSHHQIMSRRLLLSVAGVTLLAASACDVPPSGLNNESAPFAVPPSDPPASAGTATPSPSGTPSPSPGPATPQPRTATKPLYELHASDKLVALTLDDGPHPTNTPEVLALLRNFGILATFFIVGECAHDHPALVREAAAEGHCLANHTYTHPDDLRRLSDVQVHDELARTSDLLHTITGQLPSWFRSPGGDWSHGMLESGAELGMRPMGWSVDPRDWSRPGTSLITERVLKAVRPGSIVLNHDGGGDRSQTIAALKTYLPILIADGYRFTAPH